MIPDTNFLDFTTAWALQREVGDTLVHHKACASQSTKPAGQLLCNCGAVVEEWRRRVQAQTGNPAPR